MQTLANISAFEDLQNQANRAMIYNSVAVFNLQPPQTGEEDDWKLVHDTITEMMSSLLTRQNQDRFQDALNSAINSLRSSYLKAGKAPDEFIHDYKNYVNELQHSYQPGLADKLEDDKVRQARKSKRLAKEKKEKELRKQSRPGQQRLARKKAERAERANKKKRNQQLKDLAEFEEYKKFDSEQRQHQAKQSQKDKFLLGDQPNLEEREPITNIRATIENDMDKAIEHGKEHRQPYHGSKQFDRSCRNHGDCPWCEGNRIHKHQRQLPADDPDDEEQFKVSVKDRINLP